MARGRPPYSPALHDFAAFCKQQRLRVYDRLRVAERRINAARRQSRAVVTCVVTIGQCSPGYVPIGGISRATRRFAREARINGGQSGMAG